MSVKINIVKPRHVPKVRCECVTVQVLFSKCEEVVVTVSDFVRCRGSRCRDERSCTTRTRSEGFFGEKAVTKGRVRCFSTWSEQRAKAERLRECRITS
jgi:hypothetical protein